MTRNRLRRARPSAITAGVAVAWSSRRRSWLCGYGGSCPAADAREPEQIAMAPSASTRTACTAALPDGAVGVAARARPHLTSRSPAVRDHEVRRSGARAPRAQEQHARVRPDVVGSGDLGRACIHQEPLAGGDPGAAGGDHAGEPLAEPIRIRSADGSRVDWLDAAASGSSCRRAPSCRRGISSRGAAQALCRARRSPQARAALCSSARDDSNVAVGGRMRWGVALGTVAVLHCPHSPPACSCPGTASRPRSRQAAIRCAANTCCVWAAA